MKKIRLELDTVTVESFPVTEAPKERGAVEGMMASRPGDTWCRDCTDYTCFDLTCEPEFC